MGSTSISLRVTPLRCDVLYIETHSTVQNLFFDDTDANIQGNVCMLIVNCVAEFETVFCGLIFKRFSFLQSIAKKPPNISV